MKRAYLLEPYRLELRDEPIPVAREHEILVKIAYCGVCTLEQRLFDGQRKIHYPLVPGHEASAVVARVGSEVVTSIREGDPVVLDLANRCHACPACLRGDSNLCENRFKDGQRVLGAFCEYLVVRPDQVLPIPRTLSLEQAALAEPLSCALRSLRRVGTSLGSTVLVLGAGTMGMLHWKAALAMGAAVFMADIDATRLETARAMGADAVFDATDTTKLTAEIRAVTGGRGVDACVITSPAHMAAEEAFRVLTPGGKVNIFTSYGDTPPLPVDMNTIHRNEFLVTGTEGRSEADFHTAVRALSLGKVVVADLISRIYPFEQVTEAVTAALGGKLYRVLVNMGV